MTRVGTRRISPYRIIVRLFMVYRVYCRQCPCLSDAVLIKLSPKVSGSRFRVQGSGFKVQGSRFNGSKVVTSEP